MFDTMTMTKIVGGVGSALLIFLLGSWAADALYSTGGGHEETAIAEGGQGEGAAEPAVEEAAVEEGPSFEELFAAADVAAGEKLYKKCKACHKLDDGANATGPSLFGVVGRDVGVAEGFSYSGTMADMGGAWTPELISEFLIKPKDLVPGTKMSFAGMKKITDRANLIAYLATIGG
ncbi:MAG: cytochrome c family protein [Marinosulfonomonas sp.]|nr:cytochrome c family protein [Marinosulfonomonas sp.]